MNEYPDLNYMRHKNDIDIDTAIQKERMKPTNIKKTKSRVSYHWSPKRRREMREEGDLMTGYYSERFIKDVIKDISERRISFREGEDYLKDFGYSLQVQTEPDHNHEQITAHRITEEVATPITEEVDEEKEERVLHKEFMLGKDLIREAANHITEESLLDLASDNHLSSNDQNLARTFLGLLELINYGNPKKYHSWHRVQSSLGFTQDWIDKIDDFEIMIERYTFSKDLIQKLKTEFTKYAQYSSEKAYVANIREYLCEAFCLLDILEELRISKSPKKISNASPPKFERFDERSIKNKEVDQIIREHASP